MVYVFRVMRIPVFGVSDVVSDVIVAELVTSS